ncbi:MAG: DUF2330 domain-containing protein [Firmicutes bacterium]|nr:DUF2330 domain-containing protein [Bacillota bacterium]
MNMPGGEKTHGTDVLSKTIRMAGIIAIALLGALLFSEGSRADMGRILTIEAKVEESAQKAIILHNLDEEVLILGTDLKADKKTTILRFIPFPSEPQVSLHEGDPFREVAALIKKHKLVFITTSKSGTPSAEPVEIRLNARLGAHNITVIKINAIQAFRQWVQAYLANMGLSQAQDYANVEDIASDYVGRDIRYFVFDVVEVTPETRFVEPIVYRFKSKDLFYPLKTSNTFGGEGEIDLVIIGPGTLCDPYFGEPLYVQGKEQSASCSCISALGKMWHVPRASTSEEISKSEVEGIYSAAQEFFRGNRAIFIQLIRYYGPYEFDDDIRIDISRAPQRAFQVSSVEDEDSSLEDLLRELR